MGNFDKWMDEVRRIAEEDFFLDPDGVAAFDEDVFEDYFFDGLSPDEALEEYLESEE